MPVEVISSPFVGREESRGGFGQRRLFVTVKTEDGSVERRLASEVVEKSQKGSKNPEKPESPEAENA